MTVASDEVGVPLPPPSLSQSLYYTQSQATPSSPPATPQKSVAPTTKITRKKVEKAATDTQSPRKLRGRPGQASGGDDEALRKEEASVVPSQHGKKVSVLDEDFSLSPVEVRSKGDHTPHQRDPAPRQTRRAAAMSIAPQQEAEGPPQGKSAAGNAQPSLDQTEGKGRGKSSLNWSMQKSRAAPPTGRSRMEESAPQSIDSSIFAPNSLTPSVGGGEGPSKVDISLPSSGMMTEIFRKKTRSTKKRFFLDESESEEEVESKGPASKKQRADADVATPPRPSLGGPGESQGPPKPLEAPGESQGPSKQSLVQRSQADVFGGLRNKGSRRKVADDKSVFRVSASPLKRKRDDSDDMGGGHHLEASGSRSKVKVQQSGADDNDVMIIGESLSQYDNVSGSARKKKKLSKPGSAAGKTSSIPTKPLGSLDPVLDISQDASIPVGDGVTDISPTPRMHMQSVTTHISASSSSSTPFLSTRKRRKKAESREPDTQRSPAPSGANSSAFVAGSEFSQRSFTSLTFNKHREDIPLTAVSTGGRRSKATPITAADALWMKEERSEVVGGGGEVEDEDPLEGGYGGCAPARNYQPVMSTDGFIMARETPKLVVCMLFCCCCCLSELVTLGNVATLLLTCCCGCCCCCG